MKIFFKKAILVFIGLIILLLLFLPTLVKNYIVKNSEELIGAQITIHKIEYNYFTSTLKIHDFKLCERGNSNELLSLDTFSIDIEPLKLIENKLEVEELTVSDLDVNVVLKDSVFNFDNLIAYHTSTETDTLNTETSEPLKYSFSNIGLKDANVIFNNQDVDSKLDLTNVFLTIPYIASNQKEKINAGIKCVLENNGELTADLNLDFVTGEFNTEIITNNVTFKPFYGYITKYADINGFDGLLNSNIRIDGNVNNPISSIVSGVAEVFNFKMTDENDKDLLKSNHIKAKLSKIDYAKEFYKIDSLELYDPYIHFSLDSVSNNMFRVFKLYPEEQLSVADSINSIQIDSVSNMYYAINHVDINNGILDYSDSHTGELFEYHLSKIEIHSDSLFSDAKDLNIVADMLLNNRGTLNAELVFDPSDFMNTTLDFRVENFLLSDVNIYANHYMGHNVLNGDFYYYSHSNIVDGNINSENKLLVKNVSVESERGGLYNVPLKLALFLLKDSHGDVNLDIPIKGNLNDPKVNIGRLIWHTFKNLIVKVVASPVKLLSRMVSGDPEDLKQIKFSYLETTLSNKQKDQLGKLVQLEKKKDGLKIDLVYTPNLKNQNQKVAEQEVGKMYFNARNKDYLKNKEDFNKYIFDKVGIDTISVSEAIRKLVNPKKIDSISKHYNQIRIDKTKAYLKSINDFTQIKITTSEKVTDDVVNSEACFQVKYAIQE